MTQKRFEYYGQGFWYDNVEDADLESKDILNSLNELYKENEQLKEQNENYRCALEQCGVNVKILDGDVE